MGKNNLLLGTARGKLGDVVFYRTGGEQRFRVRVRPTNPKTNAQLLQRIVVSTCVKSYSSVMYVCNHAFQNFEGKLKNQERYMRLNIMDFRPVALKNVVSWSPIRWGSLNYGNWVKKDAVLPVVNPYIVSEGDLPTPVIGFQNAYNNYYPIFARELEEQNAADFTYREFADFLGVNVGDQLTFIWQIAESRTSPNIAKTFISRIVLMPGNGTPDDKIFKYLADRQTMVIQEPNKENYGSFIFNTISVGEDEDKQRFLYILPNNDTTDKNRLASFAVIVSRFDNGMWRRSSSRFEVAENWANLAKMEDAVASFLRDQSSSLYLNQAQSEEEASLQNEEYSSIAEEETQIQQEDTTRRKQKK